MDFNRMYAFCLRAGQTRSDGTRTGTGKRGDTRAARTEGGDDDAPQEEGDTQKAASTRRHPDLSRFIRNRRDAECHTRMHLYKY